jgi:hypothetical protein
MNHARSTDVWVDGGRDGIWGEWWAEEIILPQALADHPRGDY